jgi:hypothetical protein
MKGAEKRGREKIRRRERDGECRTGKREIKERKGRGRNGLGRQAYEKRRREWEGEEKRRGRERLRKSEGDRGEDYETGEILKGKNIVLVLLSKTSRNFNIK